MQLGHPSLAILAFTGSSTYAALQKHDQGLQQPLLGDSIITGRSVREALRDAEIIPDVLDDFEPSFLITPYYPSKNKTVELGNSIEPSAVASSPDIYYNYPIPPTTTVKPNTTFTLVLTDPDATSRADPVKAQMCHWILTNATLASSDPLDSDRVELRFYPPKNGLVELESYLPPSPPPKTGYHRYVFVLLESKPDKGPSTLPKKPKDRPHWGYGKIGAGVREWAEENDLLVVGANFFYSQNKKQ
ncbi:MAG: hypothetical protein Q9163_003199 [Psora crenata]